MAPVRAIVMMALALPVVVTGFTNQSPAIRHAASAGCRRDSGRRAAAVATPPGDSELIRQSLAFLEEASG